MHTCISLYTHHISHMHMTHNTHTHTHTQDVCYDQMQSLPFSTMEFMLVGPIHTTHQLLHVLDLYILDCLLKVALPKPLRSRNLLQMTASAQILGGCVSLVLESYIQYRGIRYLPLPPHVVFTGLAYWIAVMYVVDWYVV